MRMQPLQVPWGQTHPDVSTLEPRRDRQTWFISRPGLACAVLAGRAQSRKELSRGHDAPLNQRALQCRPADGRRSATGVCLGGQVMKKSAGCEARDPRRHEGATAMGQPGRGHATVVTSQSNKHCTRHSRPVDEPSELWGEIGLSKTGGCARLEHRSCRSPSVLGSLP